MDGSNIFKFWGKNERLAFFCRRLGSASTIGQKKTLRIPWATNTRERKSLRLASFGAQKNVILDGVLMAETTRSEMSESDSIGFSCRNPHEGTFE